MRSEIIVAILSLVGTGIGTLGGILTTQKLVTYRLQKLEEKVDKHNNVIEKTYGLEKDIQDMRKDLDKVDAEHQKTKEKHQ